VLVGQQQIVHLAAGDFRGISGLVHHSGSPGGSVRTFR
jgi:hypothetical protein